MFFNLEPQPVPNAYYPPPPNANFIQAPVVTPDPNYSLPVAQPQQRIDTPSTYKSHRHYFIQHGRRLRGLLQPTGQ